MKATLVKAPTCFKIVVGEEESDWADYGDLATVECEGRVYVSDPTGDADLGEDTIYLCKRVPCSIESQDEDPPEADDDEEPDDPDDEGHPEVTEIEVDENKEK